MLLAALAATATAAGVTLAVVAHRRHLSTHRLVAAVAAGLGAYTLALAVVVETDDGARAVAALIPSSAGWAAGAALVVIGGCVAVPLARWLHRREVSR